MGNLRSIKASNLIQYKDNNDSDGHPDGQNEFRIIFVVRMVKMVT